MYNNIKIIYINISLKMMQTYIIIIKLIIYFLCMNFTFHLMLNTIILEYYKK